MRVVTTVVDPNTDGLVPVLVSGFRDIIYDATTDQMWGNKDNTPTGWSILG